MKIYLNKEEKETGARYVADLAAEMQLPARGVAIAVDGCIVPSVEWKTRQLTDGCSVTVIKAAFGG